MDSTHKHRKGFREDQVVLSEAYTSIYNEEIGGDFKLSGQFHPSQEQGIRKHIMNLVNYVTDNNIKVVSYMDGPTLNALGDAMAKVAPTMVSWFRTEYGLSNLARDVISAMGNVEDYEMMEGEEGELSDDWMKQDYESRQAEAEALGKHNKGLAMILGGKNPDWKGPEDSQQGIEEEYYSALTQIEDAIANSHPEGDINMTELTDAFEQLSRGLIHMFDEDEVMDLMSGGRATRRAEADSQPEQFNPIEFPNDE